MNGLKKGNPKIESLHSIFIKGTRGERTSATRGKMARTESRRSTVTATSRKETETELYE
jgi:hypothetical protein